MYVRNEIDKEEKYNVVPFPHHFTTKVIHQETSKEVDVQIFDEILNEQGSYGVLRLRLKVNNEEIGYLIYDTPLFMDSHSLYVAELKNKNEDLYKHIGSILLEAAFVKSIKQGHQGNLHLISDGGSWRFYEKLEFSYTNLNDETLQKMQEFKRLYPGRVNQIFSDLAIRSKGETEPKKIDMHLSPEVIERKKVQFGLFKNTTSNDVTKNNDNSNEQQALLKKVNHSSNCCSIL